ncbi:MULTISPECIES: apolipoprotein N-acyltransferase [Dietzia]|uniref:Apolipoprotein N-acyltransferase n=2 Tax=Dietzia TaxID=37914 RepID=A0AAD0JQR0_9ACTN|nr:MULTISPECIES: apolipoprotein N-acyltransferase [Dietzia]AWH95409.1 apolipoprotein N-acyltransferase [Dietzia psychralcaliphila]MBB1017276.1 apolipoprotein N-acyltransferase [Dietzia sp. DQ11-71]MDN4507573.1 apolipoprotein N-acyltransferase [Dietzia maris]OAV77150.1 apolipoprotein N-acyltransferase [Dietzia sp. 111N12-1]PTM84305.1 apolipoprotein N-acyltransferase [Dietzia psychralcaliphila]
MTLLVIRLGLAAMAGALVYAAFPPVGWWPTAFAGLALLVLALGPVRGRHPGTGTGALLGLVFGVVFFLLLVPWVGLYVGAYAAWGLALVEGLYLAAFGAGAVHLVRVGVQSGPFAVATTIGLAAWWSLWESIRGSWPWGGFPWGALAFGHADGVLLPLAALGGSRFLGTAIAATGFAAGLMILALLDRARPVSVAAPLAIPGAVLALLAIASTDLVTPNLGRAGTQQLRVAVIQGNVPRLGLDFNSQRTAVLRNHLDATYRLAGRVVAGEDLQPDLVLWPENASDVPVLDTREAAEQITAASEAVGAPISLGTIDRIADGPESFNTQLLWDGTSGPVDRHDKKYIQPFGEWLPWRGLFEALFPVAESAGHFLAGDGSGTLETSGVVTGVATCFEVAFDSAVRTPVAGGAQVLTVPTNNATFGYSPMTYQQLAMSRVRAVEHNVPVLVAATSGVSAVIAKDGTIEQRTEIFEAATLLADLPLGDAGTLATQVGAHVEIALDVLGIVALVLSLVFLRRAAILRRHLSPRSQETLS